MTTRLGVGSWTYPWAIGMEGFPQPSRPLRAIDLLKKADQLGLGRIQIAHNLPLHNVSDAELAELAAEAQKRNITIETGTRGTDPEHLRTYLEISKHLRSPLLRTMPWSPSKRPSPADVQRDLKEVAPEFDAAGVSIALENYEQYKTVEWAEIVEKVGSPYIGICLDTVNSLAALEPPDAVVEILAPYTLCLHVKDFEIRRLDHTMGFELIGAPAGKGMLDIPGIFAQIQESGQDPSVILEQWVPLEDSIESTVATEERWAGQSIAFLQTLFD